MSVHFINEPYGVELPVPKTKGRLGDIDVYRKAEDAISRAQSIKRIAEKSSDVDIFATLTRLSRSNPDIRILYKKPFIEWFRNNVYSPTGHNHLFMGNLINNPIVLQLLNGFPVPIWVNGENPNPNIKWIPSHQQTTIRDIKTLLNGELGFQISLRPSLNVSVTKELMELLNYPELITIHSQPTNKNYVFPDGYPDYAKPQLNTL